MKENFMFFFIILKFFVEFGYFSYSRPGRSLIIYYDRIAIWRKLLPLQDLHKVRFLLRFQEKKAELEENVLRKMNIFGFFNHYFFQWSPRAWNIFKIALSCLFQLEKYVLRRFWQEKKRHFQPKMSIFQKKMKIFGFFNHNFFQWPLRASNYFSIVFGSIRLRITSLKAVWMREKIKNVKFP